MFRAGNNILMLAAIVVAGEASAGNDIVSLKGSESTVANATNRSVTETVLKMPTAHSVKEKARTLSLVGLDGAMHTLEDWKGKVVVLNFWATWCSPCLSEIRDFVVYQDRYKTRGLQIIGVGMDEEKKLRNVQRTLEINYPVLIAEPEKNGTLMEQWGNRSGIVPYSVVIDRNGRVVFTQSGQIDRDTFNDSVLPLLN